MTVAIHNSQPTILFTPNLRSKRIIRQNQKKSLNFYCYSSIDYRIELWTNLSPKKQWLGIPFSHSKQNYHLSVNTAHLPPDEYEFTLRFTTMDDTSEQWSWLGKPSENGVIRIVCHNALPCPVSAPSFAAVPQLKFVAKERATHTHLWHFRTQQYTQQNNSCFSLGRFNHPIHSYVSLIRKGSTWLTPVAGMHDFKDRSPEERWQLFLYQDSEQGNINLWMAISQYSDCWLSPTCNDKDTSTLNFHCAATTDSAAHLLIASTSETKSFTQLVQFALDYYHHSIKEQGDKKIEMPSISLETDILLDKLGFCTWNAFGKDVDINKVRSALDSLKSHNIPVGYLLLDDGWQQISEAKQQLTALDASHKKFPGGLQHTVEQLKWDYPFIQYIGVWHTLWGYWNGVDELLAKNNDYEWYTYQTVIKNDAIGILKNPASFYRDFYRYLSQAGVDFVKVDNQGNFQDLATATVKERMCLWDSYRQEMVKNADTFLSGRVIHCMSLTPHVLFHPILSNTNKAIFRNSDDFFPNEKDSHAWHIYANAINSLWTTNYSVIGDWDIFQSDHPFAEYHATSRAISGGPIYITDLPNKHNLRLIQKLIGQNRRGEYTILRSAEAPQPTFETVFNNPMNDQSLLSLYNLNQEQRSLLCPNPERQQQYRVSDYGVCGFWNTGSDMRLGVVTNDIFSAKKLSLMSTIAYVVSGPDHGKIMHLSRQQANDGISYNEAITVRVDGFGSSLVSISPLQSLGHLSVACLGLVDKFNGTKTILQTSLVKSESIKYYASYKARISHRSASCGFWIGTEASSVKRSCQFSKMEPQQVFLDGQLLNNAQDWTWFPENGLLIVNMMNVSLDISSEDYFYIQIDIKRT